MVPLFRREASCSSIMVPLARRVGFIKQYGGASLQKERLYLAV